MVKSPVLTTSDTDLIVFFFFCDYCLYDIAIFIVHYQAYCTHCFVPYTTFTVHSSLPFS